MCPPLRSRMTTRALFSNFLLIPAATRSHAISNRHSAAGSVDESAVASCAACQYHGKFLGFIGLLRFAPVVFIARQHERYVRATAGTRKNIWASIFPLGVLLRYATIRRLSPG